MPWGDEQFPRVRRPYRLPVVLSQEEVVQFFDYIPSLKYRAVLMTCYGAGLRISEAVALKISDIDSKRMLIRVEQGKGQKDRYSMLSPRLRKVLQIWYRAARPEYWLFPGWRTDATSLLPPFKWPAAKPVRAAGSANALRLIRFATVSPPTCWRTAPTFASFKLCSVIVRWTPRLATLPFHRK